MSSRCRGLVATADIQASVTSGTNSDWPVRMTLLTGWFNRASSRDKLVRPRRERWRLTVSACAQPTRWMVPSAERTSKKQKSARKGTAPDSQTLQSGLIIAGNKLRADVQEKTLRILGLMAIGCRHRKIVQLGPTILASARTLRVTLTRGRQSGALSSQGGGDSIEVAFIVLHREPFDS